MPVAPRLELRHLQMIRAIARRGRLTDAAEDLGLTPSALSHRIREAERRLGVSLFTRQHKRLRMTPAAEYLAEAAERVLAELLRVEADVERMNRGVAHVVRLAIEAYSAYHWLPEFLSYLQEAAPGIELQVVALAGRDTATALTNRDVDLVIRSGREEPSGFAFRPLFEDELLFIMPPAHRHSAKGFIEADDIVGERFITTTKVPRADQEFALFFRPNESYPRWTATVEMPEAIVELVAAGRGSSILAAWAVRAAIDQGRILGAKLGPEGLQVPWRVMLRAEDRERGPVAETAEALSSWCRDRGGLAPPEGG